MVGEQKTVMFLQTDETVDKEVTVWQSCHIGPALSGF